MARWQCAVSRLAWTLRQNVTQDKIYPEYIDYRILARQIIDTITSDTSATQIHLPARTDPLKTKPCLYYGDNQASF